MWTRLTKSSIFRYFSVFGSVVFLDQATKFLFSHSTTLNTGISLSLLSSIPIWPFLIFWTVGWSITWWFLAIPRWSHAIFWGFAVSNILDRLIFGGVRDIWIIPGTNIVNNLADWGIASITIYWMYNLAKRTNFHA